MNTKLVTNCLSWTAVAGVAFTSWLSVKCSKKAELETDSKKKLKAYIPSVVSGVVTCACILTSNHISQKALAGTAATCAYLLSNRDRIKKNLEGTKELDISNASMIAPWEGPSIEWTGKGTTLVIDAYSGRMFYSSMKAVESAEDAVNELLSCAECVSYNDFYRELGISITHFGDQFGWNPYFENYEGPIEFINTVHRDDRGEEFIVIDIFSTSFPMENWKGGARSVGNQKKLRG